jgi:CysZ protein
MHGGQAFLLVFIVLVVLNVPTFMFGILAAKCALYLRPSLKRFFVIRWVFPITVALVLMVFGVGISAVHLERPWPTRPVLSGWGCLGLMCVIDFGLFFLWSWLKYRECNKRPTVVTPQVADDIPIPFTVGSPTPSVIENNEGAMPIAQTPFAAFREGLTSPWNGWRYMWQQPALWRYGLMPLVMNLLVAGLLVAVLIAVVGYLLVAIHPNFADGWQGRAIEVLVALAALILACGLSAIMWVILQGIFCGHFYSKLAEQVELRLGMAREDIREVRFTQRVVDTLGDAGFLTGVNFGLLLLHCVPGFGSLISVAGSYYFTCMTLGSDYLEHPLSLRGKRRPERQAFARRNRSHTLGLGTGVALVSLVPLVNAVLLTTAVAGAVLLHRRLAGYDGNVAELEMPEVETGSEIVLHGQSCAWAGTRPINDSRPL